MVVFGHRLDSMTPEVFSNPTDSMDTRPVECMLVQALVLGIFMMSKQKLAILGYSLVRAHFADTLSREQL